MEHSYSRDWRPAENSKVMSTRTIMVNRAPQCPSCHSHTNDEGIDVDEQHKSSALPYDEEEAMKAMEYTTQIAYCVKNSNSDEEDWVEAVNKFGWSIVQQNLFAKVANILDLDRLARLARKSREHESVFRRADIDKSCQRMRQALATVGWDMRLTQWLHGVLMDHLPPSYMSLYLDILQTLKAKLPAMIDKMIFGRNTHITHDLMGPVMKEPWEPKINHKNRKLPNQPIIIILPNGPSVSPASNRMQKWFALFATMGSVVPIAIHAGGVAIQKQGMQTVVEQLVTVSRAKIQDIRAESPGRPIILVGFNSGAALALQIGALEPASSIVCMGFACNTMQGVRGCPDDMIQEITTPILFVIGQNSARTSQEEIESLRENMIAHTSVVIVGSADDALRVNTKKRRIEKVTQAMVDNMVMDEVAEFATTCLVSPPGPRQTPGGGLNQSTILTSNGIPGGATAAVRKRKITGDSEGGDDKPTPTKTPRPVGRPRLNNKPILGRSPKKPITGPGIVQPTSEALDIAIQSILPTDGGSEATDTIMSTSEVMKNKSPILTSYEIVQGKITQKVEINPKIASGAVSSLVSRSPNSTTISGVGGTPIMLPIIQRPKVKMVPANQFVQLKPGNLESVGSTSQVYTIKSGTTISAPSKTPQLYTIKTSSGNKVISMKKQSPPAPQLVTVSSAGLHNKYTIMKSTKSVASSDADKSHPDLTSTNIFDIPIVFADNEGNIHESEASTEDADTSSESTVRALSPQKESESSPNTSRIFNIISSNKTSTPGNKVVFINRNTGTIKPNIISKNVPPLKYTKVVVSSSPGQSGIRQMDTGTSVVTSHLPIVTNKMVKVKASEIDRSGLVTSRPIPSSKLQPIIINVEADKASARSTSSDGTSKIPHTIYLKPNSGSIRQIPGILNKNLTVKKLVNIVQQNKNRPDAPSE
ncbi:KAT8 regulatory NSL complex subunit 3 isoform X2 [Phlebotomus argentipes]|nr:KAT8 regulatory NSL complex subunit 3 isoform X2 [Phlebotomus argentipes]